MTYITQHPVPVALHDGMSLIGIQNKEGFNLIEKS